VLALCFPASVRLPPHRGIGHSHLANEAESDSLSLRLAGLPLCGFIALDFSNRRSQRYMLKEQLHGGLLSFHKISQACPGAPTREHAVWLGLAGNPHATHGGSGALHPMFWLNELS